MIEKPRSPTKTIDGMGLRVEQLFLKVPQKGLIVAGCDGATDSVAINPTKIKPYFFRDRSYSEIHNHVSEKGVEFPAMPSIMDMVALDVTHSMRAMIVAQTHEDTGKVMGYSFLRKTKHRKRLSEDERREWEAYIIDGSKPLQSAADFKRLAELFGFQYKPVPVSGYRFNSERVLFEEVA